MRLAWIAAGLGTASVLSSHSFAAVFDYQTVITDSDVGLIGGIKQVVLQDGKRVAAILDNEDFNETLVYKEQGVPGSYTVIATVGDTAFDSSAVYGSLSNVSFSSDRVVFASTHDDGLTTGVYGYQVGNAGYRLIADGATTPGGTFDNNEKAGVTINTSGDALVSGKLASNEVIKLAGANGPASAQTIVSDASGNLSNFNDTVFTLGTKKVFSEFIGNPAAVFLAEDPNDSNNRLIAQARLSDGFVGPARFTESDVPFTQGTYGVRPVQLIGATTDATLFTASLSQVGGGPNLDSGDHALVYQGTSGPLLIKQFDNPGNESVLAEMTADGKAAFIVDNEVYYFDGSTSTAQLLATAGTIIGSTTIDEISLTAAPMVNESGVVVFQALMSDSKMALLAWNGTELVELAHEGESITLDGDPTEYVLDLLLPATLNADLPFDHDVLKDGLSEDNHVAFGIAYDGFAAAAVVVMEIPGASVPEPSGAVVMLGALSGVTLRRRRS